jgi:hypothetical protein
MTKTEKGGADGQPYDYGKNFKVLSVNEKRRILKTAKTLLKQQKENNALLAGVPPAQNEGEKQGVV